MQQRLREERQGGETSRHPPAASVVEALEGRRLLAGDVVLEWNEVLLQSVAAQPSRFIARDLALVQVAVFDAANAIDRSYEPYAARVAAPRGTSAKAAAAQAAHDTLAALFPARTAIFAAELAEDLAGIPAARAANGVAVGKEVARQILALRANDGSADVETYTPPNADPGQWQPTPPDNSPAGAAHVPSMTPFALRSSEQFRPPPPPALTSRRYAADLNEVKAIGSRTSTVRTDDQTEVAMVWRLPVTNHLVWNRIAQDVSEERDNNLVENARLFALMNVALHDGLQTSFASKFHYGLWRPVTAIRRADEDGNPATQADPNWIMLHPGVPPYPSYAGNASTIGASCATVLAEFFGRDNVDFTVDFAPYGFVGVTRSYDGFWEAADEEARSRVYGGIHFNFDSVAGQRIGRNVGNYVVDNLLEPEDDRRGHGRGHHGRDDRDRDDCDRGRRGSPFFDGDWGLRRDSFFDDRDERDDD